MNSPARDTADSTVIDESACRAYIREIREILGVDLFAMIVDGSGQTLWTDDPVRADQLTAGLRRMPTPNGDRRMVIVSPAWAIVQLPLRAGSNRQIEIDSTLTASWLRPSLAAQTPSEVDDILALPAQESELHNTLATLCTQWRRRAGLAALAVYLPERDLLTNTCWAPCTYSTPVAINYCRSCRAR